MLIEELDEEVLTEEVADYNSLLLYNDDYNTFEHVIECLIKYCDHNPNQAHQCAVITHNNGKCEIKRGSYEDLKPIKDALIEQGLSVVIN